MEAPQWLSQVVFAATVLSVGMAIVALVAVPWVVRKLPADYFARPHRRHSQRTRGVAEHLVVGVKNLIGALFVLLGIVLLFMPGQGLLTLLVGVMLMNFPGKHRLEGYIVSQSGVYGALNWMRRKQNLPDFILPGSDDTDAPGK
ncbi:hypothetical protein A3709_09175 [Halioglobus sp. HI00S01]|uniref:hypothetical protein n=1 Tax=Halioglobus sp. HI00S01 TaxID=1822214 RepID=UPI0007C38B03|nr:hypothetical protein [Halioglobus sp. HI00S01]KZX55148.1 hypothetical protein A3709_09175 [Halioglobus sp. HI00S01]